jgi:Dolichyl-phosphate-mannose-protein mannosyltransferase
MQGISRSDLLLFGGIVLLGLAGKSLIGWYAPFWLDETYTGVIASQADLAGLIDWCRHELSGPLYYSFSWLWARVAGTGDVALRISSLVFSFITIALIWFRGSTDTKVRLIWAALIACWYHGLFYATQARPQALLLLLATAQAILFVRCYPKPSTRNAAMWAVLGSLLLLTHVHTAILTTLQGAALAWTARSEWRRLWPVTLAFLPAVAWLGLQLPFLLTFAQPQNTWYPLIGITDIGMVAQHLLGGSFVALVAAMAVTLAMFQVNVRESMRDGKGRLKAEVVLLVLALLASLTVFVIGMIKPSYDGRYLVPFAPAMLLGIAFVLRQSTLLRGALPGILVVAFALPCALTMVDNRSAALQRGLYPLEFQSASNWLMQRGSSRAIFAWDNRAATINSDARLREIGGFFFTRANQQATIEVARVGADGVKLLTLSDAEAADIIWVGGKAFPDALLSAPQLSCQRFGDPDSSQSLACERKD